MRPSEQDDDGEDLQRVDDRARLRFFAIGAQLREKISAEREDRRCEEQRGGEVGDPPDEHFPPDDAGGGVRDDEQVAGNRAERGVDQRAEKEKDQERAHVAQVGMEIATHAEDEPRNHPLARAHQAAEQQPFEIRVRTPRSRKRSEHDSNRCPDAEIHAGNDRDRGGRKENGDAVLNFEVNRQRIEQREQHKRHRDLTDANQTRTEDGRQSRHFRRE